MKKFYHELFFKIDKSCEGLLLDFIFDLGVEAVEEKDGGFYIRSSEDLDELVWALELFCERLSNLKNSPLNFNFTLVKKENKDWIEEYKKGIEPILIDKIYIHTTWQEHKRGYLNIQINPALAFGSGHHESTHSCIELLQKFVKKDMKALDVGCGSGILAIILAKFGAKVDICDTDELALKSALDNAKLNEVSFCKAWQGSLDKAEGKYDFIVANIIADVILILEKDMKNCLKENAILILSGILDKYEARIKDKFKDLSLVCELRKNEWLSLVYKKEKNERK
ncbi:50S ribosomal protein L11 methyltransferase [Campylobacter helveticus]|uniref:50S ribosomal protein L11 methyltransferase n=1 Tax=Campylobacter helveticus TaxID=28898 RepID=UPI0022EB9EE1|nr:50S ribosomal protein L11 methyltransferase [Campylobacter helveticus]